MFKVSADVKQSENGFTKKKAIKVNYDSTGASDKNDKSRVIKERGGHNGGSTKHIPCKFFKNGNCSAADKCPFLHDMNSFSNKPVCSYFLKGNCKYGAKCALSHNLDQSPPRDGEKSNRNVYQHQHTPVLPNSGKSNNKYNNLTFNKPEDLGSPKIGQYLDTNQHVSHSPPSNQQSRYLANNPIKLSVFQGINNPRNGAVNNLSLSLQGESHINNGVYRPLVPVGISKSFKTPNSELYTPANDIFSAPFNSSNKAFDDLDLIHFRNQYENKFDLNLPRHSNVNTNGNIQLNKSDQLDSVESSASPNCIPMLDQKKPVFNNKKFSPELAFQVDSIFSMPKITHSGSNTVDLTFDLNSNSYSNSNSNLSLNPNLSLDGSSGYGDNVDTYRGTRKISNFLRSDDLSFQPTPNFMNIKRIKQLKIGKGQQSDQVSQVGQQAAQTYYSPFVSNFVPFSLMDLVEPDEFNDYPNAPSTTVSESYSTRVSLPDSFSRYSSQANYRNALSGSMQPHSGSSNITSSVPEPFPIDSSINLELNHNLNHSLNHTPQKNKLFENFQSAYGLNSDPKNNSSTDVFPDQKSFFPTKKPNQFFNPEYKGVWGDFSLNQRYQSSFFNPAQQNTTELKHAFPGFDLQPNSIPNLSTNTNTNIGISSYQNQNSSESTNPRLH